MVCNIDRCVGRCEIWGGVRWCEMWGIWYFKEQLGISLKSYFIIGIHLLTPSPPICSLKKDFPLCPVMWEALARRPWVGVLTSTVRGKMHTHARVRLLTAPRPLSLSDT